MAVSVKVTGGVQIKKAIQDLSKKYPRAFAGALYRLGVRVIIPATRYAPVEFGVLRSSHYVSAPQQIGSGNVRVELGFGTDYAATQHEGVRFRHPKGGRAKFLKLAVDAAMPTALANLTADTIDLAGRGGGWGQSGGIPTRPSVSATKRGPQRKSNQRRTAKGTRGAQNRARLKAARANLKNRTGR